MRPDTSIQTMRAKRQEMKVMPHTEPRPIALGSWSAGVKPVIYQDISMFKVAIQLTINIKICENISTVVNWSRNAGMGLVSMGYILICHPAKMPHNSLWLILINFQLPNCIYFVKGLHQFMTNTKWVGISSEYPVFYDILVFLLQNEILPKTDHLLGLVHVHNLALH